MTFSLVVQTSTPPPPRFTPDLTTTFNTIFTTEFLDHYLKICEDGGYSDEQSGTHDVLRNNLTWEAQCAVLKDILHDTRTNYEWDIPRYH